MHRIQATALALLAFGAAAAWAEDSGKTIKTTPDPLSLDNWATGIALVRPVTRGVLDASIIGNTVRVNSSARYEATLLVARHFYPGSDAKVNRCTTAPSMKECLGVMIATGISSSNTGNGSGQVINFLGAGFTVGGGVANDPTSTWHLGLGLGRRFNYKVLGDGFKEGEAPPTGETAIRYKTIDVSAPFAFFTAHW